MTLPFPYLAMMKIRMASRTTASPVYSRQKAVLL